MTAPARRDQDRPTPTVLYLLVIVAAALAIRSVFSYGVVFNGPRVNFQDNDSWYHMRVIDNLAAHWPRALKHDPFALPGGQFVPMAPLFDLVVSGAAMAAGLGSPTARTVEVVSAWMPALLGALIPIPIFLAGRRLFGDRAALIGAALVAIMPGHLLDRSRLGYVDHHVLEALLGAVVLWLGVRAAQQPEGRARLIASLWLGLGLGAYLLAWSSGTFVVAIVVVWMAAQAMADAMRGGAPRSAAIIGGVSAAVALVIALLFQARTFQLPFQLVGLTAAIVFAVALELVHSGLARAGRSPRLTPVVMALAAVAAVFIAARINPALFGSVLHEARRILPDQTAYTVIEAMPLSAYATSPWARVIPILVMGTGLPLGALGLAGLAVAVARNPRPDWMLALVWTAVVLAATLLRNRFGYYLVPMLALLGGAFASWCLDRVQARGARRDLAAVVLGAVIFAPNVWPARTQIRVDSGPPGEWIAATDWLRAATPDPFGDPAFYTSVYTRESSVRLPAYTVLAWWDYGYWITRAARRVPVANPTQAGAAIAAEFFVTGDRATAARVLEDSRVRFIVIDSQLPFHLVPPPVFVLGKFETILAWAARPTTEFYEGMYIRDPQTGGLRPMLIFHPAYYRAMVNRLYHYGGLAVTPSESHVITYADRTTAAGRRYREVTALESFPSYEQAVARLKSLGPGPHRLVGLAPERTPVPLEALPEYRPVWASPQSGPWPRHPAIVVFERMAGRR